MNVYWYLYIDGTLGGRKAVVSFVDMERDEYVRIHRSSDVLALCQQDEVCVLNLCRDS